MTLEQQLQLLLTEAEQVTAKMREALAKMEAPAQWTPKKGDWAEVTRVSHTDTFKGIKVGDVVQVDEQGCNFPFCIFSDGQIYSLSISQLRHLPDYQQKPKLATTYEEVVEAVKPEWICCGNGIIENLPTEPFFVTTESAAKQDKAFIQIKNLEAYFADRYKGEREYVIDIDRNGKLSITNFPYAPFKFKKEAADFVIRHFPEIFKIYYGVE